MLRLRLARSIRVYVLTVLGACCLSLAQGRVVAAQSGENMGQGEAAIAVRSDVTLSVKGTGGTSSERLAKLGQAVSDRMGDIRSCYREQVSSAPEVMGKVRLKLRLEKDKKPAIEVLDQTEGSGPLLVCVTKVLTRAKYADVGRPASAFLSMTFDNSRARGQAEMIEQAAKLAHVDVRDTLSGQREARWSTEGDEVEFRVRSEPSEPDDSVAIVMNWVRRHYAGFLDCRRRCEQGGISPEGDIEIHLAVDARGRVKPTYGQVTVAHRRAHSCSEQLIKRTKFDKPSAPFHARLDVHFAP